MQLSLLEILDDVDYRNQRVVIGLSGGINSAAVLAYVASQIENKPKDLHLFYAHFSEHSTGTLDFVFDCVNYAKKHFENVTFKMTENSINEFFVEKKMIPHPMVAPCTKILKVLPIREYMIDNKIDVDLVGYVREEKRRVKNQQKFAQQRKEYPILHLSNEDCFVLVKKEIGYYPDIYDIFWSDKRILPFLNFRKESMPKQQFDVVMKYAMRGYGHRKTKRVFSHNNCLPCKNMQTWEYYMTMLFFPDAIEKANETADVIGSYWGRDADAFYEMGKSTSCTYCEI